MQTLAGLFERQSQFLKADGGIDKISQDGLPYRCIPRKVRIECLGEQGLSKSRVTLYSSRHRLFEFPCQCHDASVTPHTFLLLLRRVVGPSLSGRLNGLLLALLRTATRENDELSAVLAKINAIAWTRINLSLKDCVPALIIESRTPAEATHNLMCLRSISSCLVMLLFRRSLP